MKLTDKNEQYFGLDIGTTSVRLVQLQPGESKPELVAYSEHEIAGQAQDQVDTEKDLAESIKGGVDAAGITTKSAVVAISNRDSHTAVVTVPRLSAEDLADHVRSQAGQYLPIEHDDTRLDWHIVDPEVGQDQMEILLVAAPGEVVDRQAEIVSKAGLDLRAVEVNALAVARSVISEGDESFSVVVDLGSDKTEITTVWRRLPYVVDCVDIGGDTLTDLVKDSFNVDRGQAQQFLRDFGLAESKLEGGVLKATGDALGQILNSVRSAMDKFRSQAGEVKFGRIILTGVPVSLPGLPSYIAEQLQLPAEIANPWMNVTYPAADHDILMSQSLRFAVAVGLAQKEVM